MGTYAELTNSFSFGPAAARFFLGVAGRNHIASLIRSAAPFF